MKRTRTTAKEEEEGDWVYVVTWTTRYDSHDATAEDAHFSIKGVFRNQKDADDCKTKVETERTLEHMASVDIGEDDTERRALLEKDFDHYLDAAQECEYSVFGKEFACEIHKEQLK